MTDDLYIDSGAIAQLFDGQDLYLLKPENGLSGFPIEGTNTNSVAIVYHSATGIAPEDKEQLYKILAALKLDPTAIALINLADVQGPGFSTVARATGCRYLLVFGATPADMSIFVAAKRYVEINMQGVRILFSDSLELLRAEAQRKRYLWDTLQVMFGLK